ncbi:MAG: long-chain fatty acid--CoA ligase [Bacteroidota bacterium]
MEITRIFDLLPYYAEKFLPKDDVLACKENGDWKKFSLQQYTEAANNISYGLLALGVNPGDKIASITNNRPEWNFLDMGIMQVGAIHVPIYPTISESDYLTILNHAEVKYIFVSGEELLRKIQNIIADIPSIKEVFSIKPVNGNRQLSDLILIGKNQPQPKLLEEIKTSIHTDELVTLIYTSGTTGIPKGVMLSHQNIISNFKGVSYIPTFGEEGKALSFLPLCHIYERMLNYLYQYLGISIYYAESLATITENIREIKPDMMCCVPRLLEKIYDKILSAGKKQKGIKKMIFFWALNLGLRFEPGEKKNWWYMAKHKIAEKLVFVKWREALGGNFKIIVSGGAAIQPRIMRVFWAAGLPVYEGYGLTETSPVIATTSSIPNGLKVGTVGPPIKEATVKIAEDGEILCKGPGIMLGYYKDETLTNQVIDTDGWFHTGDIGHIEKEGQLRITGRKKEIFKTSLGKYIAPDLIENILKESAFIDNLMVVGENQKFAGALIVPDFNHLRSWCLIKNIEYASDMEMITLPQIRKRYLKEIHKYNKQLGTTEQIKKFELLPTEWTLTSGELSPTLKLKRSFITKKYCDILNKMFDTENQPCA